MQNPREPFDSAIPYQAIVEAYEREAYEGCREGEGDLGNEGDYVGWLDHVIS